MKRMEPWTVKRQGSGHHVSASQIRAELAAAAPEEWNRRQQAYWQMAAAAVLRADRSQLEQILSAGGGLSDKLKKEIRYASSVEELLDRLKTVSYTHLHRQNTGHELVIMSYPGKITPDEYEAFRFYLESHVMKDAVMKDAFL